GPPETGATFVSRPHILLQTRGYGVEQIFVFLNFDFRVKLVLHSFSPLPAYPAGGALWLVWSGWAVLRRAQVGKLFEAPTLVENLGQHVLWRDSFPPENNH